jgi:hypothetical protein
MRRSGGSGPDFVAAHRRRYGNRPARQRQLTYDIAVLDEYASWRDWVDQELALLPADAIAENQSLSATSCFSWRDDNAGLEAVARRPTQC